MGNYVIPKIAGESAITWNGTAYWPVTSWTIGPGISTGSGDSWIAGAVRYLVGEDSNVGSVHVIAQFSGYTRTGSIDTSNGYFLIRRIGSSITTYTGTQSNPGDFWTTQNSNQRQGYVYNIVRTGNFLWYDTPYFVQDFGTKTEGTTVTAATFYIGTSEVIGGVYQQTSVSASYTIPEAPADPTSITNTRNSDTKNTVSWTLPATTYTRMRLQRLVDGGTVGAEWTFSSTSGVTSYVDTGTSAAHSYSYRLRLELVPEAGEAYTLSSSWKTSSVTYNTPAKPTAISGARIAASTVRVTLTNTATTSTGLEVQASTSSSDWSGAISSTFAGAGLTTADVAGLSGTYYFRARNTRGALVSAWSPVSNAVVTLTPPNPPTLTSPANGSVINYSQSNSAVLKWTHNPIDGSAQTAAQIGISTDGGSTWTTTSVTTAQQYTLSLTSYLGDTVTWRVRTKGADASYGNWSSTRTFRVFPEPTVTITLTDPNNTDVTNGNISNMPMGYAITATDGYTTVSSGTVAIAGYTENLNTGTMAGTITTTEVTLTNNTTYTFSASVVMSSGLTGAGAVTVTTDFAPPRAGNMTAYEEDGIVTIRVTVLPIQPGEVGAGGGIGLFRVTDGTEVMLATGLTHGDTVIDRYAPLNKDFIYRVVTYSTAGAARAEDFPQKIVSNRWYVMTDNATAWGIWNPAGSLQFARPEKTRVQYAGRTYPVSYDGSALSDSRSSSWQLLDMDERDRFIAVMADGGRGVYKSCDGDVFKADFDLRFSANYTSSGRYGTATLSITRIESEAI